MRIEIAAPEIRTQLGEVPLWCGGRLFWVDVAEPALFVMEQREVRRIALPRPPGALCPAAADGSRLLVALRGGLMLCDVGAGTLSPLPLPFDLGERRFNDGRCDAEGRLWLGMMDRKLASPIGGLLRIDGDSAEQVADGVTLSNGVAFSPDGGTIYLADTKAGSIFAFDVRDGAISNRRLFFHLGPGPAQPDGCTVDAEGNLWIAGVNGGMLIQVSPKGRKLREVPLPVTRPTSCAFGGPDLATLYVTSARHGLAEPEAEAGALLAITGLEARGLPEHVARLPSEIPA